MRKKMTQERLNKEFSVLRTGLAVGIGILLSILIILIVSDNPLLSIQYLVLGPVMNFNNFCSLLTMWIPCLLYTSQDMWGTGKIEPKLLYFL